MIIKVKTLTGKEIEVEIDLDNSIEQVEEFVKPTILTIKEKVQEAEGIPPAQQRLIFGGRQLVDSTDVEDYNIEAGQVIHLVLALRGGC